MKGPSSQMQTTTKATLPDVIPATMRAATLLGAGGPDMLRVEDRPVPMPGPAQMLIRTAWAGVNPHDCAQRQRGSGPAGQTDILGLEVSGIVAGVGEGVDERMIGERVVALVMGGGNAEWCIAEEKLVLPLPDHISFREGGALPEGMFTAWFNVMEAGRLAHGEWLLVHGGTGGVGSAAIQIAVACGARVISTGGSAEKQAIARELGATLAPDDVLTAIDLPLWPADHGWSWQEYARRHGDFAIAGAGALLTLDGAGRIDRAALVIAGLGAVPVRLEAGERMLLNEAPSEALFTAIAAEAETLEAMEDAYVTAQYRQHLAGVLCRRALREAAIRAKEGSLAHV